MPLHTVLIKGLAIYGEERSYYTVTLQASLGIFNTLADVPEEVVEGRGKNKVTISTKHLQILNHILKYLTYTSTVFSIDTMDVVKFHMAGHEASFPVIIRQPQIPVLFDTGPDQKISSLVTVATKTFLRYDKVRLLIKSIRQFYPDITIIVADDNENTEKGWFAGRNLPVSQVTTKYFLLVDDDFIFTENTKLEKFVQVLEETDLDVERMLLCARNTLLDAAMLSSLVPLISQSISLCEAVNIHIASLGAHNMGTFGQHNLVMPISVGGSVDGNDFKFKILYQEGDEDGSCLHRRHGSYHKLEGFPNCVVASGVVNFFLAHARRVLAIGFDPKLQSVAHTEFFIDGFGSLRVGSCYKI
ncbi:beta-1,4 N-acetylgalactosaminyltransferase 2-like [Discoglossus pictus]